MAMELIECLAPTFDEFCGRSAKQYLLKHLRCLQPIPVSGKALGVVPIPEIFFKKGGYFFFGGFYQLLAH
jgi:hypothetical protein